MLEKDALVIKGKDTSVHVFIKTVSFDCSSF